MFFLYFSHHETEASKNSRSDADSTESCKALLEGHHRLVVQIAIVLHLSEHHVGSESLHSVVYLVLPKFVGGLAHPKVRPSRVGFPVKVLVVLDCGKSLLQDGRVKKGVQGVTAHR